MTSETKEAVVVTEPTKTMTWEEFHEKTDNANKLMDRVWYAIAATEADIGKQKIFWEHWYWKEGSDSKSLNDKEGQNHTLTIDADGKEVDYPIWPVTFTKTSMKKCTLPLIWDVDASLLPWDSP